MFDKGSHHIPEDYVSCGVKGAMLWQSENDRKQPSKLDITSIAEEALASVSRLLAFEPQRNIHFVVYESLDDSWLALSRRVPPSFLMAPLHTSETAVIVLHSAHLDPRNGDEPRMFRHLCHEVTHVCNAERTASTKRLGDGDVGMGIRPWVDEGFAVCVANEVANRSDVFERALAVQDVDVGSMDMIDNELRALNSSKRAWAFQVATSQVLRAIHRHSYRFVFNNLENPHLWA